MDKEVCGERGGEKLSKIITKGNCVLSLKRDGTREHKKLQTQEKYVREVNVR